MYRMRKVLFILLLGFAALQVSFGQTKIGVMEFDSLAVDLGVFPRDSSLRHCAFSFRNTGTEPLVIYAASPDCPCVKVHIPVKTIPSGGTGTFEVTYDGTRKRLGSFRQLIYFAVSAPPRNFRLQIHGRMTE
jgi:hypothetical protein